MKSNVSGVITYSPSRSYQVTGTTVTKYYGGYALRESGQLYYLLTDHLGSTSMTLNSSGQVIAELRYKAFGETRVVKGTTPTDRRYTGQRQQVDTGLYFYNTRWYDPALGRFTSPDSIVPGAGSPQAWDRYAYVNNNPINKTDPSGHWSCEGLTGSRYTGCTRNNSDYASLSKTDIFFGGSDPKDINAKGPSPSIQSPMWTTNGSGNPVWVVPYPGTGELSGKEQQAIDAQGLLPDVSVNIVAYSAGTESALLYAKWRLEHGQGVSSIVLLGPTFDTSTMDFNNPDGGWKAVLNYLIDAGVNIRVLDDGLDYRDTNAANPSNYNPTTVCKTKCGVFKYQQRVWEHYSEHPNFPFGWGWFQGTNNNPILKTEIYKWMESPSP